MRIPGKMRPAPPHPPDGRASWARGYAIGGQIVGIALELVVPCLGGFYLDRRFGTLPVLTLIGVALGLASATLHFIQFYNSQLRQREPPRSK